MAGVGVVRRNGVAAEIQRVAGAPVQQLRVRFDRLHRELRRRLAAHPPWHLQVHGGEVTLDRRLEAVALLEAQLGAGRGVLLGECRRRRRRRCRRCVRCGGSLGRSGRCGRAAVGTLTRAAALAARRRRWRRCRRRTGLFLVEEVEHAALGRRWRWCLGVICRRRCRCRERLPPSRRRRRPLSPLGGNLPRRAACAAVEHKGSVVLGGRVGKPVRFGAALNVVERHVAPHHKGLADPVVDDLEPRAVGAERGLPPLAARLRPDYGAHGHCHGHRKRR